MRERDIERLEQKYAYMHRKCTYVHREISVVYNYDSSRTITPGARFVEKDKMRPTAGAKCWSKVKNSCKNSDNVIYEKSRFPLAFCLIQNCFSALLFAALRPNLELRNVLYFLTPAASRVTLIWSVLLRQSMLIRIQMPFLHRESHVSNQQPHPFETDPFISDSARF